MDIDGSRRIQGDTASPALGTAALGVVYRKNPTALWTILSISLTLEVVGGFRAS